MNELRAEREKLGMTQKQLSVLTGIPFRTIQNWEEGSRKPSPWVKKIVLFYIRYITR